MVGGVTNATWVDAILTHEEHQYIAIDRRTGDGTALDVTSLLKCFAKRRYTRLPHEENKAAERNMIARRLRHARSGWGNIRCRYVYCTDGPPQRISLVKLNAGAAG